jgi:hypothetical protein
VTLSLTPIASAILAFTLRIYAYRFSKELPPPPPPELFDAKCPMPIPRKSTELSIHKNLTEPFCCFCFSLFRSFGEGGFAEALDLKEKRTMQFITATIIFF